MITTTILDQFITCENDDSFYDFRVLCPLSKCDHSPIACKMRIKTIKARTFAKRGWNLKSMNWKKINEEFSNIN